MPGLLSASCLYITSDFSSRFFSMMSSPSEVAQTTEPEVPSAAAGGAAGKQPVFEGAQRND